jgi:hypothetical protein
MDGLQIILVLSGYTGFSYRNQFKYLVQTGYLYSIDMALTLLQSLCGLVIRIIFTVSTYYLTRRTFVSY